MFIEIFVIVLESQRSEIAQRVAKLPLKVKCEFISLVEEETGTADALRVINERISKDVLILSCDTVTNVDFYPVLNMFRSQDASLVSLFIKGNGIASLSNVNVPGPKLKPKQERDLVGINVENNRLLFLASTTDYHENVSLPGHLLRSNGKIKIFCGLSDSHIYLMKRWVLDYLAKSEKFSTLKGELLPFVIKKQLSRPLNPHNGAYSEVNFDSNDIFEYVKHNELNQKMLETNLNNFSRIKRSNESELIRCFAYISPTNFACVRVNTIQNYCLINSQIISLFPSIVGSKNTEASLISNQATIKSTQMSDTAVGENTTISEKTSIKSSVFGASCNVNPKTRISNSFIMNNVEVGENVVIENSIVCDKAVISKGSVLKNCIVGHNYIVPESTTKEKAHLTGEEIFMEI